MLLLQNGSIYFAKDDKELIYFTAFEVWLQFSGFFFVFLQEGKFLVT